MNGINFLHTVIMSVLPIGEVILVPIHTNVAVIRFNDCPMMTFDRILDLILEYAGHGKLISYR